MKPRFMEAKLADVYRMRDNPEAEDYDPFKADFRNFLYYAIKEVLRFGEPGEIQYDIADYMQNLPISQDGIARGQVQAMRGCGKSVIAAIFVCWLWYCNPTIRVVMVGSTGSKAEEFAGLCKQIIDGAELLAHLRPNTYSSMPMRHGKKRLKTDKNQLTAFDIAGAGPGKDPSFAAYGVFGAYTGNHPDILIPDDVEIPENSLTCKARARLLGKMREFESLIMEFGAILQMGTPQTEESVYTACKRLGYPIRKWPAELPDPNDERSLEDVAPWLINRLTAGEKPGTPSYPERFPVSRLLEKRAKGEAYYRLQYLLDCRMADADRYPLKLSNLIVYDQDFEMGPTSIIWGTASPLQIDHRGLDEDCFYNPAFVSNEYIPYQQSVMYIDPAGGGADSVGYAVGRFLRGVIFIPDAGGLACGQGQYGTSEGAMIKLAKIAAQWGIKQVIVEGNWGGDKKTSAYAQLLQPVMAKYNGPTQITVAWSQGQKERRILDCLEPLVNAHKVVISQSVAKSGELIYQFTHITRERGSLIHDDEIEAFWGVVNHFMPLIQIDPEQEAAKQLEAEALQTAKEFEQEYRKSQGGTVFDDPWSARHIRRNTMLHRGKRWGKV